MKKLLLLFFSISCFSQAPSIEWIKTYGGTASENSQDIIQTLDGGYISVGDTLSCNGDVVGNHNCVNGNADLWVIKLSSSGVIQWTKALGGTYSELGCSIKQEVNGDYIICGTVFSNDGDVTNHHGGSDFWMVKLNSTGTLIWQKTYGGSGAEDAREMQKTSDGGYIACGFTTSNNGDVTGYHGDYDYWIVKTDSNGTLQWQKTLGGSGDDQANSIAQTADGGYIVSGWTSSSNGDVTSFNGCYDAWVVKLSSTGQLQWQKTYGTNNCELGFPIKKTADNGFIIAAKQLNNAWIIKINETGTIQWQKTIGGTDIDEINNIIQVNDGGYLATGRSHSTNGDLTGIPGIGKSWVFKLDSTGGIVWQKKIGGSNMEYGNGIIQDTDNDIIVSGNTQSSDGDITGFHGGYSDLLIYKLTFDPLSVSNFDEKEFILYPNPASSQLNIQSQNNLSINKIMIYNMLGKTILEQSGNAESINIQSLSNSIYIIKIESGEKIYQTKFIKQ